MGFLDSVVVPNRLAPTSPNRGAIVRGGFLDRIVMPQDEARARGVFNIRQRAEQAQKEAEQLSSFGGLFKETADQILRKKPQQFGETFISSTFQTYQNFAPQFVENISEAAKDIRAGKPLKGVLKAGVRTAGDAAIAIFAPLSAAIGAALEVTRGQKLIDKTGEVIADKNGITDLPRFQQFAIEHPNAGADFDRLLFLGLTALGGKQKIEPKRIASEAKVVAEKLVATVKPKSQTSITETRGKFFERIEIPEREALREVSEGKPVEVPTRIAPKVEGKKTSGIARSIEERAIEQRLTEGFEGKAGFDPITVKEQARLVSELVSKDLERARRMVRGEEAIPDNLRGSSLIVGLEEAALKSKNIELLKELADSPLTSETSRAAQELRILAERSPDSPVKIIQDVKRTRESNAGARKTTSTEIKKIQKSIKKSSSKRPTWEEFINEVKCNF